MTKQYWLLLKRQILSQLRFSQFFPYNHLQLCKYISRKNGFFLFIWIPNIITFFRKKVNSHYYIKNPVRIWIMAKCIITKYCYAYIIFLYKKLIDHCSRLLYNYIVSCINMNFTIKECCWLYGFFQIGRASCRERV